MRESVTDEPTPATQPIETKVEGIKYNLWDRMLLFFRKYARSRNSTFLPSTHKWSNCLLYFQMAYEQVTIFYYFQRSLNSIASSLITNLNP